VSAGAVGGWAGHSPGGCGGAGGRTRGRGGPRAAGGTPAQPGGSTLPVPATKNRYQYMFLSFTDKKENQIFLICKEI
jgi:hypothetical protein